MLDRRMVRGVAMENTAGLRRGAFVWQTGGPIRVPAGKKVLGRVINVIGFPIGHLGAFESDGLLPNLPAFMSRVRS